MEEMKIPKEKFEFAEKRDLTHDSRLLTKPTGYFKDALRRFCRNKGAVVAAFVIAFLILFAIIAPFCTPYTVSEEDASFANALPKSHLFENTSFWDGCAYKEVGEENFIYDYAIGQESGRYVVKNQEYKILENGLYAYRQDSYHKQGCVFVNLQKPQYESLQEYQNKTGIQVIYPITVLSQRPEAPQDEKDANYYYKTVKRGSKTAAVLDENGNVIPIYRAYSEVDGKPQDDYYSLRIEGDAKTDENGKVTYSYSYARITQTGYEVRVNNYEYYIYKHALRNDGITEPYFVFGATGSGRDVFANLASGARFSFIFAFAVALVNMVVGAIYGAIEGYYGGKTDLIMERISDILSAIPTMIVITLLKLHMGGTSQALVLFIAFFLTGWIGMAGRTRMQFYRFKNQEYVLAARTLGAKDRRLIWKHIFPNAIGTLVTSCALVIPSMIFSEASLSYLGIISLEAGNITSVGTLISAGQRSLSSFPHIAIFPSVFLVLLMLSFNLFGNGLRDAFNPYLRGTE